MKKIICIILVILSFGCDSENAFDCIQAEGSIIQEEFLVDDFTKITVFQRIQLIVGQGEKSVIVETGDNLLNDIEVYVTNGKLVLKNNNACNLGRDYGITKIFVTSPNLIEIRNSSGLTVLSSNTLNFNNLTLLSEDFEEEDAFHTDGDFNLDLEVENLTITQNNLSNFFLTGNVINLDLNFTFGDARFEGRDLIVQHADVYHRGTNDIIINPQQSLVGTLLSTGDMIVVNTPPIVDVDVLYTGDLIFED